MPTQAIQNIKNMNKKAIDKMKDEMGGIPILDFIDLKCIASTGQFWTTSGN